MRDFLIEPRKSKKLTHEQIAVEAGITRQYYGMIENGEKTPSVPVAKSIAAVLGIEWTLFFEGERNVRLRKIEHSEIPQGLS